MKSKIELQSFDGKTKLIFHSFYRPTDIPLDDDRMWEYNVKIESMDLIAEARVVDGFETSEFLRLISSIANNPNVTTQTPKINFGSGVLQVEVVSLLQNDFILGIKLNKIDYQSGWEKQWSADIEMKINLEKLKIFNNQLSTFFQINAP